MLSWAAHKPFERIFAAHTSKKGFGLQKLKKNYMGCPSIRWVLFNFLMGRTGKRKDA